MLEAQCFITELTYFCVIFHLIYPMFIVLFASQTFAAAAAASSSISSKQHGCMHDLYAADFAANLKKHAPLVLNRSTLPTTDGRQPRQSSVAPIRFTVSSQDLEASSQYCGAAGESRPTFTVNGVNAVCSADDILTAEKKTRLLTMIDGALTRLKNIFSLVPVTSPIKVPAGVCGGSNIVPSTFVNPGVSNTDYVLFVSAGPFQSDSLGFAGGCVNEAGTNRIVVGSANFNPATLDVLAQSTVIHEFFHAMGFDNSRFTKKTKTIRGKTAEIVTSSRIVAEYRAFIGCDTLEGIELEDEGGAGSQGSHFDRRVVPEEVMAAAGGDRLSRLSLAVFEDIGHYSVSYNEADEMNFGRNAQCGYVSEKCSTTAGGKDTWFCFDTSAVTSSSADNFCTYDYMSRGECTVRRYTSDLPEQFQYFNDARLGGLEFFDGCPTVRAFTNGRCTDTSQPTQTPLALTYGANSRCFQSSNVLQNGFNSNSLPEAVCLESQCTTGGQVQFKIGNSAFQSAAYRSGSTTDSARSVGCRLNPKALHHRLPLSLFPLLSLMAS